MIEALYGLRLRTPRLELRLGSHDELLELGRLAERGIHPPAETPFAVAWTDATGTPGFVDDFLAYHRDTLAGWSPQDWTLNLLVWADGLLAGTQGLLAERFAETRPSATPRAARAASLCRQPSSSSGGPTGVRPSPS